MKMNNNTDSKATLQLNQEIHSEDGKLPNI